MGCQRPSARSYGKIPLLARGESPVKAEDPDVDPMIARTVLEKKTLVGTHNSECLRLADCVVVDVQCDYRKRDLGNMRTGEAEMSALEATLKTIGDRIPPSCLVVRWAGRPVAVVDCFGILDDDRIRRYFVPGCEVEVLGRGHIQRIKEEVRGRRR